MKKNIKIAVVRAARDSHVIARREAHAFQSTMDIFKREETESKNFFLLLLINTKEKEFNTSLKSDMCVFYCVCFCF